MWALDILYKQIEMKARMERLPLLSDNGSAESVAAVSVVHALLGALLAHRCTSTNSGATSAYV
jgi:hypothetical protein